MKLLIENWRRFINEVNFYDSPDEDKPGNNQIILFHKEFDYSKTPDMTHGKMSHMIKHYNEFENQKVEAACKQAIKDLSNFPEVHLFNLKSSALTASGQEAIKMLQPKSMLNTFDYINDKVKVGEQLSEEENILYKKYIEPLTKEYDKLVEDTMSQAIDISNVTSKNEIEQMFQSGKTISFIGYYKGSKKEYFLNTSNSGLVAKDGDQIATLFRIDKTGNSLQKIAKYFSGSMTVENQFLQEFLGI